MAIVWWFFSVRIWTDKNNDSTTGRASSGTKAKQKRNEKLFFATSGQFCRWQYLNQVSKNILTASFQKSGSGIGQATDPRSSWEIDISEKNAKNTGLESFVKKQSAFFLGFHHWGWKYWFLKTSNFGNKKHYCFLFNGRNDVIIHIGKMVTKRIQ